MKRPKVGALYKWNGDDPSHHLIKEVEYAGNEYYLETFCLETGEDEHILYSKINCHNYELLSAVSENP